MKKISIILILGFLLAGNLFAQEADSSGVKTESSGEIGVYVKDYFPVGKMSEHAKNFIGGGLSYVYNSPIVIPVGQNGIQLGFSGRVDYAYGFASSYVNKWNAVNILAGVLFELPLNEYVTIMPGVEYGVQLDFVDSTRKANRLYLDQSLQISPTFKFNIPSLIKNGIALEASPAWAIGFEKNNVPIYLGLRLGITYRIGDSTCSKIETEEEQLAEPDEVPTPVAEEEEEIEEPTEEPAPVVEVVVVKKVEIKVNNDGTVAINIPTLSFKSNSAELTSAKSNQKTIEQVFNILSDEIYAEYRVVITGYVNPDKTEWTDDEKSLALSRAETVKQTLIGMGIDESRLEACHGSGKTDNNEFNRRVEFILTK